VPPGDTRDDDAIDLANRATQDLDPPSATVPVPHQGSEYGLTKGTGASSNPVEDAGPPLAEVPFPEKGAVYDPAKDRETTRSKLALRVVWLLMGVVALLMGSVISELNTWEQVEGMASSVLPAVLTVVGTVLGFYFGSEKVR
jgi:hypothetical protein